MLSGPTDAVRNIVRRVSFAVTGMQVNSSRGELLSLSVRHSNLQRPSGVKIHLSMNFELRLISPKSFKYSRIRQTVLVGDVDDALSVGRPPRLKMIPVAKGHFVRITADTRQNVEIVVLVPEVGTIDNPRPVGRPVGSRSIKCFLAVNLVCVRHSVRLGRHSPDRAGAQGNTSVRDKNDLLAIGRPSGFDVRIDPSKI